MPPDEAYKQTGKAVGARIRAARLARKFTQSQLAQPDFSVSYISAIERGQIQPSLRALEIIALRLGLSSTQLLPDYTGDESHLEVALDRPGRKEENAALVFLEAELALRQGAWAQARERLEQLFPKDLQHQQQVQLHYLLGWAYFDSAQLEKSKDALLEAARLAKDTSDHWIHVHVLNLLGMVYAASHHHDEAFGVYQRSLDVLTNSHLQNPFLLAQVYTNLGEHCIQLDQLEQAVAMLRRATVALEGVSTPTQVQAVYWQMCQDCLQAGEYGLAVRQMQKCLHFYEQESRLHMRGKLYHSLGQAMLKGDGSVCRSGAGLGAYVVAERSGADIASGVGDQDKARVYFESALERERVSGDLLSVASIGVHLATWFLAHQALSEAERYAQEASKGTQPFGDTVIAAEALLLLGQIAYIQLRYEVGDEYYMAGLEMLERLGLCEESAEGLARYAQLLEGRGMVQEAYLYFKRAYEYGRG